MTCDIWLGVNILSKLQLPSSYGLDLMKFRNKTTRFEGKGSTNELISYEAVCKIAPATTDLLKYTNFLVLLVASGHMTQCHVFLGLSIKLICNILTDILVLQ